MHYPKIKDHAQFLRKSGKSIGEISNTLNLGKSTISYWCRDIKLSKNAINKINKEGKNKKIFID